MKKLILISPLILLIFSCVQKENPPDIFIVGKWSLVQIDYLMYGESKKLNESESNTSYIFHKDGSFIKEVRSDNRILQAYGTFITEEVPIQKYTFNEAKLYINLVFTAGDDLAQTCIAEFEEEFILTPDNRISNYSSAPCDGPVTTFEKD